jgi:hypothetical protein
MNEGYRMDFQQALKLISDTYERKARLYPALLLLMPVVFLICCGLASDLTLPKTLCGVGISCGGLLLLAQIARDAGKRKEKSLFARWGGMPSIAIFRHRNDRVDAITRAKYHERMSKVVGGAIAPTAAEELADPMRADQIYAAWSTYVRVNTRDTKKYSLVFSENINYGYRRNLYGLRPIGITVTSMSVIGALAWLYIDYNATKVISPPLAAAALVDLAMLSLWVVYFSSDWVRIPAEAYADRLVEAIDTLSSKATKK